MSDRKLGRITVSRRTIDLAGEILAIAQIVRLREINYELRRGLSAGRTVLLLLGLLMFGSSVLIVGSGSGFELLPVLGLLLVVGALLYPLYPRTRYILAIEPATGSLTGLYAKSSAALTNLKDQIQTVIENPPTQPTTLHVGDVWAVDARESRGLQFGRDNTMLNN